MVSILAASKPWMPDILIATYSSANALCNDGSLDGVKTKQGFDDLAEEGKRFSFWTVTLSNVERSSFNVKKFQESHPPEGHSMGGASIDNGDSQTKDKLYHAMLEFMGTIMKLFQKEDTRIPHVIVKIIVQTTLFLKEKCYGKVLGLLDFTCVKLLRNGKE